MPGPSIPWKTLETEAWRTQIDSVPPARYKLASPRTITGSPSFAMKSADQYCVVRVYIGAGEAPDLSLTVSGTTPVPMTNAVGGNLTAQELADLRIEVGMPQPGFTLLTTDEPNGSPSNPFASTAVPASGNYVGERIAVANPAILPRGWGWLEWSGSIWFVPAGEPIAQQWGMDNAYLADQTPGALALTKIFQSPIIPDAFLPIRQKYELAIFAMVINASGVAGCRMGACISGGDPTSPLTSADYNYTAATSFTPTSNGVGFLEQNARYPGGRSSAGTLLHSKGGTGKILRNGAIPNFVSENNRFYLMGQPSHAADRFVFEGGYSITSLGVAA